MKTKKNTFLKHVAAVLFVLALVLPTNMNAATNGRSSSGWAEFWSIIFGGNGGRHHQGGDKSGGHHQGGDKNGGHHQGGDKPTDSIPLDGGLSFLVLGAAAFGVRKLRGNKNDKE